MVSGFTAPNDKFYINGISSDTLGIWCDYLPVPAMAQQKFSSYSANSDEESTILDDAFSNIDYQLTFHTLNRPDYDNTDIYKFLAEANTLELSRLPGYYFKVRSVSTSQPRNMRAERVDYDVSFNLAPFKYKTENPTIAVSSGDIIENTGTRYCKPTLYIDYASNFTMQCNGVEFGLKNFTGSATVDTANYIAYDSEQDILLNKTFGKFPWLAVGKNLITFSGGTLKMKLNERCY